MTELQIAQVGLGSITEYHRQGYARYAQPLLGGYDPDPAAGERMRADSPGVVVFGSVEELLDHGDVGVIDLAVPHRRDIRLPLLERIAQAGKPVLIQKPLATTYAEALEIADLLAAHGITAMVNQNMCFTPSALRFARVAVAERLVGEPTYAQILLQDQQDMGAHPWFGKDERWWTAALTVHHLGLLQLLLGPPEAVFGLLGRDAQQPGVLGDGYGHLSLNYGSGAQALVVSTGTYYGTNKVPHESEQVVLQGESGLLDWSPQSPPVLSRRVADGPLERTALGPADAGRWFPDAFGLGMAHLRDAVRTGQEPWCSVEDNLYVVATIEAAYLSAAERRVVRLAEVMGDRYDPEYGTGWGHGMASWLPPSPVASTTEGVL